MSPPNQLDAALGSGVLYVVATPIGNLEDLTARAAAILAGVDLIACEDTRHSRRLLDHLGIRKPLCAYHDHNEARTHPRLLSRLQAGDSIALISDAGTPLINDTGFTLVREARAQGIRVIPVPGPSALICALSAAGLPSDRFLFLGFPPRSSAARRAFFDQVAKEPGTLLLYESGKRMMATLEDSAAVLGETRQAVIARELTKRFETFLTGTLGDLHARLSADTDQQLGEFVLLVTGASGDEGAEQEREEARILAILCAELPTRQAAALTARITGGQRNRLYRAALTCQQAEAQTSN
ncbi:putative S-adenosylmethionine-dependent methyltransferase, YraL family [Thiorhodovibrio frisius]|uniref:Ribosomal RNA small subunit methyltransferase I n=1 Tax=Thiorhodovibrio frisius TaxID=631362 RepID=H8Z139_9GAMM|nr:16S rRNA (cytidine(1402)-2'-O)-methyltransferase [Thiorhodovibrio frisius]EIC22460.1 putative S-adenosylmethionine-dependent methyltransferase, YraL family [Thiorhodovibrio frisius]WPL24761.1 Ribosomal RNA small subunit methyltransferase I [Thiorhodovibrio frisius]